MLCALIMAGGKGTRFWPKSTEEKPKQFINLIGDKTMLQITIERINKIIPLENIFICTSEKYAYIVKEQLPKLNERNIILEPCARNTAPCILLSTLYIKELYKDANIIVLPSDHIIGNVDQFLNVIESGNDFINQNKDGIVTIGIMPTRPETGYGYIKKDGIVTNINSNDIVKVEKFVEKPNLERALEYLKEQKYLWNAGMFIFNTNYMIQEFKNNLHDMYNNLSTLPSIKDDNYYVKLKEIYENCEKVSIDYGIIEKSNNIYVIPSEFGWDDVGTWESIGRYVDNDSNGNIIKGDVVIDNAKNCIVYGNDKKIILVDIDDIFCVDSDEVIIVGKRDKINGINEYREC